MRVLLVKMSSLGDVVHALPAVTDAVRHGHSIDWVVEEAFADIARMHDGVGEVIPIAWRRWRRSLRTSLQELKGFVGRLRGERYDLILDSQGLFKSAVVALLARGKHRAGFAGSAAREPLAARAYNRRTHVPRGQHAVDRQRQLFAQTFGYPIEGEPDFGVARGKAREGQVFLLHGTTWPNKHWPFAMWTQLARDVAASGRHPVLTWGNAAEKARAEAILGQAGGEIVPRTALAELAARLGESEVVIGVDSGLTHLSAALGVPTVGLYGPTDAVLTGCRGPAAESLQATVACSPCVAKECRNYRGEALRWQGEETDPPCFATLPPDRVWGAAMALLKES